MQPSIPRRQTPVRRRPLMSRHHQTRPEKDLVSTVYQALEQVESGQISQADKTLFPSRRPVPKRRRPPPTFKLPAVTPALKPPAVMPATPTAPPAKTDVRSSHSSSSSTSPRSSSSTNKGNSVSTCRHFLDRRILCRGKTVTWNGGSWRVMRAAMALGRGALPPDHQGQSMLGSDLLWPQVHFDNLVFLSPIATKRGGGKKRKMQAASTTKPLVCVITGQGWLVSVPDVEFWRLLAAYPSPWDLPHRCR